jgi:hypothetical protein
MCRAAENQLHLARASCGLRSRRSGGRRIFHRPPETKRSVRRTVTHHPHRAGRLRRPASQQHVEARPGHVRLGRATSPQCRRVHRIRRVARAHDRALRPGRRVVGASDLDDDCRRMGRPTRHARRAHRPCHCSGSALGSVSDLHPDHARYHPRRSDACGGAAGTSDRRHDPSLTPCAQARPPSGTEVGGRLQQAQACRQESLPRSRKRRLKGLEPAVRRVGAAGAQPATRQPPGGR